MQNGEVDDEQSKYYKYDTQQKGNDRNYENGHDIFEFKMIGDG
jgi:hypothetical protein